jgi:hypothetical protein
LLILALDSAARRLEAAAKKLPLTFVGTCPPTAGEQTAHRGDGEFGDVEIGAGATSIRRPRLPCKVTPEGLGASAGLCVAPRPESDARPRRTDDQKGEVATTTALPLPLSLVDLPEHDKTLANIVNLYVQTCKSVGIDPLVAVSQMELETGHLTSKASQPPRRNRAGIGITGASTQGRSFPTWTEAVRAHVGGLAAYAIPKGEGTQAQKALISEALAVRPLPDSKRGSAPQPRACHTTGRPTGSMRRRSRRSGRRSPLSAHS